jgi:hypothetical protein
MRSTSIEASAGPAGARLVHERRASVADGSTRDPWLFSRPIDIAVFGGSAAASLLLLAVGGAAGLLESDTPDWAWVPAVLLVDVAHVYSTTLRIYLDGAELRRRPVLYSVVPIAGLAAAFGLASLGPEVFWRVLAYVAVFHFVRQQYGWVALYRRKCGEVDRVGQWLDAAAVYAATLYPLAYWHAHLPRRFWWFLEDDFAAGFPHEVVSALAPVYWSLLALYACRSLYTWLVSRRPNPGKDLVVATTAVCWYVGIVAFDSDYAFTVTNVLVHGIPYLALIYFSGKRTTTREGRSLVGRFFALGVGPFLLALWALAYIEEFLWHRLVWWERAWLFGSPWEWEALQFLALPMLALPQIVHYVLDGFIWKRGQARYL